MARSARRLLCIAAVVAALAAPAGVALDQGWLRLPTGAELGDLASRVGTGLRSLTAGWIPHSDLDDTGRALGECPEEDLGCHRFVAGRGRALLMPSPVAQRAGLPLAIGGGTLPRSPVEAERELRCLAIAAYAEARNQGVRGMAAVVWVVMNRAAEGGRFGTGPCAVLNRPGQFEPMDDARFRRVARAIRAGVLPPFPAPLDAVDGRALERARLVVWQMLDGFFATDPTGGAQYFLAPRTMIALGRPMPEWTAVYQRTASIGAHDFYRAE